MFKPMLAGTIKVDEPGWEKKIKFPVLASRKLDGFRATVQEGQLVSRQLKKIANVHTRLKFGRPELEGLDGELIVGDPTAPDVFRKTSSAVNSLAGEPDAKFYVFDQFLPQASFKYRLPAAHENASLVEDCVPVEHLVITTVDALLELETAWVGAGYEGVMLRSLHGPYKQGRSTLNEGYLLKLKRFVDGEGIVIGFEECMHNNNVATVNALGYTERSSHKENKVPAGTLGSFLVKDVKTGLEHKVAPGRLTAPEAKEIWENRPQFMGKIVHHRYFPSGSKDKPRFPQFYGWREATDM